MNVFIYDPIAPDPQGIIDQGLGNATARAVQVHQDEPIDEAGPDRALQGVIANNRAGGWRRLKDA